jgi:predicted TIM-barrel fold metal-dependent hydrolase
VEVLTDGPLIDGPLIDGHCHTVTGADPDRAEFERWCTEADQPAPSGLSYLDSHVGVAVRRWCPPALGLPVHSPIDEYLTRRGELGWREATTRLLRAARLSALLVDTGLNAGRRGIPVAELGKLAAAPVHEVIRLERVAEDLRREGVDAAGFAESYRAELSTRTTNAVATKSIIAYRHGLDVSAERPARPEVRRAAGVWLQTGGRLIDPVLLQFMLWAGVDTGLPLQIHTGFGDRQLRLSAADPALLQPFLAAVEPTGVPVVLLHCYPYHRQAGWLALVYPHVYVDVGLTIGQLGLRAAGVLAEFCELAPFGKLLFSTDAYGLPELYLVGAAQFRRALRRLLDAWIADAAMSTMDAERVAGLISAGNVQRVYGLNPQRPQTAD